MTLPPAFTKAQDAPPTRASLENLDPGKIPAKLVGQLPEGTVAVVDAVEGEIHSLAFSAKGRLATGIDDGSIVLWDLNGAEPKRMARLGGDRPQRIKRLSFSLDGDRLASDGTDRVQVWSMTPEGAELALSEDMPRLNGVALHPNGRLLVTGVGTKATLWKIAGGQLEGIRALDGAVSDYTFSADGMAFASVRFDQGSNGDRYGSRAHVWRFSGGAGEGALESELIVEEHRSITSIALSADSKLLATGSAHRMDDGTRKYVARLWNFNGKQPENFVGQVLVPHAARRMHFTPHGSYLVIVTGGRDILLWNLSTKQIEKTWAFEVPKGSVFDKGGMSGMIADAALAPDGRHLALSNHNRHAVIVRLPIQSGPAEPASN
jgi:WD40 repeat protein